MSTADTPAPMSSQQAHHSRNVNHPSPTTRCCPRRHRQQSHQHRRRLQLRPTFPPTMVLPLPATAWLADEGQLFDVEWQLTEVSAEAWCRSALRLVAKVMRVDLQTRLLMMRDLVPTYLFFGVFVAVATPRCYLPADVPGEAAWCEAGARTHSGTRKYNELARRPSTAKVQ